MPGTYIAGEPVVTIAAFAPQLHVITSKQRPRKLTIHGSDGAEYVFLLKVGLRITLRQEGAREGGGREMTRVGRLSRGGVFEQRVGDWAEEGRFE